MNLPSRRFDAGPREQQAGHAVQLTAWRLSGEPFPVPEVEHTLEQQLSGAISSVGNRESLDLDLKLGPSQRLDPDERARRKRSIPEMGPHGLTDDVRFFGGISNDVNRDLDDFADRRTRRGQRYDQVPESSVGLGRETAVTRNNLTPIDSHLTRYRDDAKQRPLGNHHLREKRAPVRQLGWVEVSQLHRVPVAGQVNGECAQPMYR